MSLPLLLLGWLWSLHTQFKLPQHYPAGLATVTNTLCKIWERWVNVALHLRQPVEVIAKCIKVLSEREGRKDATTGF